MNETDLVKVSVYQKEKEGNFCCGDSYYYYQDDDFFLCALADGLGSGELARESSQVVMDVIKTNPLMTTSEIISLSNQALVGKRGVVLGILKLDLRNHQYTYASIGNIGLMTITSEGIKNRNIPMPGYLGVYPRQAKEIRGIFNKNMSFVLFSDGVTPKDLTHNLFKKQNVTEITDAFAEQMGQNREDDTTLIVIKFQ
ncbi:SpoIIE family protein phosphatase [Amphibacillus sp. MSJ-3]|uniref:SpoIIE family protein phosphatase n=1 Tax=Amphibacillus sp. MSJ-3 TaxID=2841505 RepID=UPI001C0F0133|nr:SpoIIE family protein phosphatase [Amphibacillus sp. MSJ-3]MBU5595715.1 SpoIIE family protein phosphatase [Amphibacillus sp. MSJ-3]